MASTAKKKLPAKRKARKTVARPRKAARGSAKRKSNAVSRNALPLFLSACIVFCLAVIALLAYRSAAGSDFFELRNVEIVGVQRAAKDNVERVVRAEVSESGVWDADLDAIRSRVEEMTFVRSAAVSRVLPGGIRISIFEHEPKAIVQINGENHLVTAKGQVLARATTEEPTLPFAIVGWNTEKSPDAEKENAERVELYQEMLADWQEYGLTDRVELLDLRNLREPRAHVEDGGNMVTIAVGREKFGENLSRAIKAITGKSDVFSGVDLVGSNLILAPRETTTEAPANR